MVSVSGSRLWDLPHRERVEVVRDEIDRVASRLGGLTSDQLDSPAVGDWTVGAVIAHLVVVPEFYAGNIRRGASGDATAPARRPEPGTGRGEIAAATILEQAKDLANAHADTVVDRFRSSASALADALDAEESSLEYECYHPGGIVPANRFMVLFLKELGLHEWDMFEALEPPHRMSQWGIDAAMQAMEEELASGSLRWVTDDEPNPDTVALRVITSGDVVVERDLIIGPEGTRLVAVDRGRKIDSELRLDAADFVLGCSGRRDLVAVIVDGRGEGDVDAVGAFARRLTGM